MGNITGFRDRIKVLSPSWLQDGTNEREMYVYGLGMDAVSEKLFQGVRARFPTQAPSSAQDEIGKDRVILRGLTEGDESYGVRLQRAFESYQFSGSARAVLSQLLGFLLSKTPRVVSFSSRYDRSTYPPARLDSQWDVYPAGRDPKAEPVHTYVTAGGGNADWDSLSEVNGSWSWWGGFIVLEAVAPNDWVGPSPWAIGDGQTIGMLPGSMGLSCSPNTMTAARGIVKQWKGAHTWEREIIVSFNPALFDPSRPTGGVNPDGTFGDWYKVVNGVCVPTRFQDARYCGAVV